MGRDGSSSAADPLRVARDAFGFNLHYFSNDYSPVGSGIAGFANPFAPLNANLPATADLIQMGANLYNGNIRAMTVNIPQIGEAILYGYRYDQLNRIKAMNSFGGFNNISNLFGSGNLPVVSENYKERITYDPNGNIKTYLRNGSTQGGRQLTMDNLTYQYERQGDGRLASNRLRYVQDPVPGSNYSDDIDSQTALNAVQVSADNSLSQAGDNYQYDAIGNLIKDAKESISSITWNAYGKISGISKTNGTVIAYKYDPSGNRICKTVTPGGGPAVQTIYVRDASGNVMSIYTKDAAVNGGAYTQSEISLYGSSRLGIWNLNRNVSGISSVDYSNYRNNFVRGAKFFELTNHLGNVLVTISDKKLGHNAGNGTYDYYDADIVTANDYYPFGMQMPGREYNAGSGYRYGFNGQEKSTEINVSENLYTAEFWQYDARLGRRWNVDPLADVEPGWSPYRAFYDNPIKYIDPDGQLEYESADAFAKANKGKTWDKDRGKGDWLRSDRENNTDIWGNANKFNLQQKDGFKQYNSIEQRAGFYGWYAVQEDLRGGETKWAGAAYIVAKQMTLMDVFYKSGDLQMMYGAKDAKDLNGFANAGNKAIFDDVFDNLRDNLNGAAKKGAAATQWDAQTLHREQFDIVQPIYEAWIKYNPKLNNYLQDFASGKGLSRFMQMPRELRFDGKIINAQDRYNHGMNKVVPFYDRLRKAQRPR